MKPLPPKLPAVDFDSLEMPAAEMEACFLIARGLRAKEAADLAGVGVSAFRKRVRKAMARTGLKGQAELGLVFAVWTAMREVSQVTASPTRATMEN